jgi:hypothetical protein
MLAAPVHERRPDQSNLHLIRTDLHSEVSLPDGDGLQRPVPRRGRVRTVYQDGIHLTREPVSALSPASCFSILLARRLNPDLWRMPMVFICGNVLFAYLMVISVSMLSGFAIWRRLRPHDSVAVLKTRE